MQNLVYPTAGEASLVCRAEFVLASCEHCGFAFNAAFDASALVYDERYDNRVPSDVFKEYYAGLARHLCQRYGNEGGLVVEIGCGKGEFLTVLAREWRNGRFLGVDPGYEAESPDVPQGAKIEFVTDVFNPDSIRERPSLVVCRHTLEHIPDPGSFLRQIRAALPPDVPVYLEVPDLRWILANRAFWDFCYEHCNYFTAESLAFIAQLAGFRVVSAGVGFGNQYLWLEAISGEATLAPQGNSSVGEILRCYGHDEDRQIAQTKAHLEAETRRGVAVCLWGMATKGVVFSYLVDPERTLIRYCIDVNSNKQGKYAPGSAHLIQTPEVLQGLSGEVLILVMNPNYLNEVRNKCRALGIAASFADARCQALSL
jgi:SAM-dependent methyltransferase